MKLFWLVALAVLGAATAQTPCTEACSTNSGDDGYYMCIARGNSGKYATQCVAEDRVEFQEGRGNECGCCNVEGIPDECPNVTEEGCAAEGEVEELCDTGGEGEGVYMCVPRGNSGREATQCVKPDRVASLQGRGANCGCCTDDGLCPTEGCSADPNAVECGNEENGPKGYYMCRKLGNPKTPRFRTQCVNDNNNQTLARQLKGDKCGCCDPANPGQASATCPPDTCGAEFACEKGDGEDDGEGDSDGEPTNFFYMCRAPQGNDGKRRTVCVNEKQIAKQGRFGAQCGCCEYDDVTGTWGVGDCPDVCTGETCGTDEDSGETKYWMCRTKQGRSQCTPESVTLKRQEQGIATCGCCEAPAACPAPPTDDGGDDEPDAPFDGGDGAV